MVVAPVSASLDAEAVADYFADPTPASVLYVLTLFQPLTAREVTAHPFRQQYLALQGPAPGSEATVPVALERGVACGALLPVSQEGGPFYFLNSDVGVRPPPLDAAEAIPEVSAEPPVARLSEGTALPLETELGAQHPIPHYRDPSACLTWFRWLTDAPRRRVLQAIQRLEGPSPRDLEEAADVDGDLLTEGIRSGILRSKEGHLAFQFAEAEIPPRGKPWTAHPPRFCLTRSYEPLECLEEAETYLADPREKSPMSLLAEMVEDGRRVLSERRHDHLRVNLLYRPTAVVPRIDELSPETLPSVWENRRGRYYAVTEGYARAVATYYLTVELGAETEEVKAWRRDALRELARQKLDAYFRAREEALGTQLREEVDSGYGLGPDAIQSVATAELQREGLLAERKYYEKFLEVLAE